MSSFLSDLLSPDRVALDLPASDASEAIRAVAALLRGNPDVGDVNRLSHEILEREALSSTAMGHGVAFPHARTDQVRHLVMAAGRSPDGITFQGVPDPVHFLFVIGTPPGEVAQYLATVGRLARLLKEDAIRAQLLAAQSPHDFLATLHAD